jgi:iron-sulfur cluster assembly accessory protein
MENAGVVEVIPAVLRGFAAMVTVTPSAILAVKRFISDSDGHIEGLRIFISTSARSHLHCGLRLETRTQPTDEVIDCGSVKLIIDRESAPLIDGVTIDFVDDRETSGFRFTNLKTHTPGYRTGAEKG